MKKLIEFLRVNINSIHIKTAVLLIFILFLTGSDLIVKQIVYKKIKYKDFEIIPKVFMFHYVTNDDIGFSALRWLGKYLDLPKKISKKRYEKIINKIDQPYKKDFISNYYKIDNTGKYYILDKSIIENQYEKNFIMHIFSEAGVRTPKWIFLCFLQGFATLLVIFFYYKSKLIKHIMPFAVIIGGALGNVIDRIIRGYVVDFIYVYLDFIPFDIFHPWPIFNLADIYTVIGTAILFIIFLFFTKEPKEEE